MNRLVLEWKRVQSLLAAVGLSALMLILLFGAGFILPTQAGDQTPNNQPYQTQNGFTVSAPINPADTTGMAPVEGDFLVPTGEGPRKEFLSLPRQAEISAEPDSALQSTAGQTSTPPFQMSFNGMRDTTGIQPPDTDGQVGPNDYIQMVNSVNGGSEIGIYDKTTGSLKYPIFGMAFLYPAATACRDKGAGDPVVLFDQLANRWILTQFVDPGPPFYECFAISKTSTPTNNPNDWWLYAMPVSDVYFNDYPKIGVWPDGYYMMAHQFSGNAWAGTGVWVFERDKMLAGQPAVFQYKNLGTVNINYGGMLPSNLMGGILPPIGAPNYFIEIDDNWESSGNDIMHVFAFHTDWTNPNNTSFSTVNQLVVAPYTPLTCGTTRDQCIDQPGRPKSLEAVADRLMMHAWYRNMGGHEVIVVNHTVNADGLGKAGVRWYEIRKITPSYNGWNIYQQGTYAPDASHRWMGGIAMDFVGNIALGYSVSSSTLSPSVRYTIRQPGDPLGTMGTEQSLVEGASSTQNFRWGDYSSMSVDPVDDCTFWYTQEYIPALTSAWHTRIGSFRFPNCVKGATGSLTGIASNSATGAPISGAVIQASLAPTLTYPAQSQANGTYALTLLAGTYTVTGSVYGFLPISQGGILVSENQTTNHNLEFSPAPTVTISGKVTDAQKGWALYARISVKGSPLNPSAPYNLAWSDLSTGDYSLVLVAGNSYTLTVETVSPGYTPIVQQFQNLEFDQVQNFALQPDLAVCSAPGYYRKGFAENFDSATPPNLPTGWQKVIVTSSIGTDPDWVTSQGTSSNMPSNDASPAHSEPNLAYFNSYDAESGNSARLYRTIPLNMTLISDRNLTFWMYHEQNYYTSLDYIQVQVSTNGGATWENEGSKIYRSTGLDWLQHSVSLSAYSTASNLLIGFLGVSDYGMDTHLDDIALDSACSAQNGGLVVGAITNGDNGQALTGASITTDNGLVFQSQMSTDPLVGESFYTAFSPSGSHIITATRTGFGSQVVNLNVLSNQAIRHDFVLYAGKLAYSPAGVAISLNWGESGSTPVTFTNQGQGPAAFEITATVGGFNPLWPAGRAPFKRKVKVWTSIDHPYELAPSGGQKSLNPVLPYLWNEVLPIASGPVARSAAASCDGKTFYLFGGQNVFGMVKYAQQYNPAANTWKTLATMPVALSNMQAACIGDFIYLVGGYNGFAHTNEFQIYDTRTDTWAHSSWPNVRTPMTAAYNRKLYAFGGSPGPSSETWVYDPQTNQWQNQNAPLPTAAEYGAAVTVGDYIYILGGGSTTELKKVQRYDPNTNTWSPGPDLPEGRLSPIAAWYGNKIFVASGGRLVNSNWVAYDTTYTYDFSSFPGGSWVKEADLISQPVVGAASVCASDRIYALGGSHNGSLFANNQYMDTGLKCHYGVNNVPWLSFLPTTGFLPAGQQNTNTRITLNFDAGDSSVFQPGTYSANLLVNNDTVYGTGRIPVTMTVLAPAGWGKITGVVNSLGYCDANPAPLARVNVLLETNSGITTTTQTDAQGFYSYWMDSVFKPITATVQYTGLQSSVNNGIMISAGQVTTQNINLRLLQPCVNASPSQFTVNLQPGKSVQFPLNLVNSGAVDASWIVYEIPGGTQIAGPNLGKPPLSAPSKASQLITAASSWPVFEPLNPASAIFVQGFESGLMPPTGWTRTATNASFTWNSDQNIFVRTGLYGASIPWDFNQNEWLLSPTFSATEGILSFWSKGSLEWCRVTYDNCDLRIWLIVGAVGGNDDVLLGKADDDWQLNYVWAQSVFNLTSLLQAQPVRIGFQYIGNNGNDIGVDDIRLDGLNNSNVLWLTEDKTSGVLAASQAKKLQITFTAAPTMTVNSIYTATLQIRTTDPQNLSIKIPVTMKIVSNNLNLPILIRVP